MDADLVDQQEGAESSASGTTLSAQQFYQHDPLLVLLKDKFRLNDLWIIVGVMVYLSVVIMLWDALLLGAALLSNNLHWFSLLEMILLAAIYVALTPALLIGWLVFPHRVMVRARDEALKPMADEYQQALMQSLSSVEHDMRTVVAETRRLTALKQRYDLVRTTFPTWPLEISGLGRLVATVVLPVLLPLISNRLAKGQEPIQQIRRNHDSPSIRDSGTNACPHRPQAAACSDPLA
jgi:uncharacterized MnhB-related membrane protein